MKSIKFFFGCALALAVAVACDNKEPQEDPNETEYDDNYWAASASISSNSERYSKTDDGSGTVDFKAEGGEVEFSVVCGTEWIAENTASDIFDVAWNCTNGTLTVSCGQNYDETEKSATVTLYTAELHVKFATIGITQDAYGAPSITAETNEWEAPAAGNLSTTVTVDASEDWTVETPEEAWLSAEKTDVATLTLTAEENEDTQERTAKVTLSCTDGIRTTYEYINVTQDAKAYITLSSESIELNGVEGTASITVESNYDWDFSYDTENGWFTVTSEDKTVTIAVSENESDDSRSGVVTFTAGDGEENVAEAQLTITQGVVTNPMILVYTTTSANQTVGLPVYGTVNVTVDWGDGSDVETLTSSNPTHAYAEAGEHTVTIDGTATELNSYSISSTRRPYLTAVKAWGELGLTNLYRAFYMCSGLTELPEETGDAFAEVTSCSYAFYKCTALETVPAGLFKDCSNVTDFTYCFDGSTALKSVPADLFSGCTAVTDCIHLFDGCTALETIESSEDSECGLFDDFTGVTKFDYVFQSCPLTSLPENLFAKCTSATSFEYALGKNSVITKLPAGLFAGCPEASDFKYTFTTCTALEEIPSGLFSNNTKADSFYATFYSCSSLEEIPEGLFDNCTAVTTLYMLFDGCESLTTVPSGLFDKMTEVGNIQALFMNCYKLPGIPSGLFDSFTSVTNAQSIFYHDSSLVSLPDHLLDKMTGVTALNNSFPACVSLTAIPDGFFKYNTNVTSFESAFNGCSSITEIPSDLFGESTSEKVSLASCFAGTSITEIPEGLFDKLTVASSFASCFSGCKSLTKVPEGLFDNNTANITFLNTFYNTTSLTEVPDGLFATSSAVTTYSGTFNGSGLTKIPSGLFGSQPSAKTISSTFKGCTALTSIPETLFAECPAVTTFEGCFSGCTSLTSIPTALLDNCTKVITVKEMFMGDTALTGESPYTVVTVDEETGETVKVHLYDRTTTYGFSKPTSYTNCFDSCEGLTDYSDMPSSWK